VSSPPGLVSTTQFKVALADVDVVQAHFAAYYRWMDYAFTEFLGYLGHPLQELLADGYGFPLVRSACDYLRPLSLGQRFLIRTMVTRVGRSSIDVRHEIANVDGVAAVGNCTHVWMDIAAGAARPAPEWIRGAANGEAGNGSTT
jgi:YbgC/YbaW family acyl-CoA thioester hydrolase